MCKRWQSWFNSYAYNERHISTGKTKNFKSGNVCYQMKNIAINEHLHYFIPDLVITVV